MMTRLYAALEAVGDRALFVAAAAALVAVAAAEGRRAVAANIEIPTLNQGA